MESDNKSESKNKKAVGGNGAAIGIALGTLAVAAIGGIYAWYSNRK